MNQSKIKFSWILLIFAAGVLALTGCMNVKPWVDFFPEKSKMV